MYCYNVGINSTLYLDNRIFINYNRSIRSKLTYIQLNQV
nr:MAG TPA: hypothetical protein [Caudoviricetes sp.]